MTGNDPSEAFGPPPDPKEGRQARLVLFLRGALAVAALLAVTALATSDELSDNAARYMTALLVAVPLARVAWLGLRWLGKGDVRFALVAALLLTIIGAAGVTVG